MRRQNTAPHNMALLNAPAAPAQCCRQLLVVALPFSAPVDLACCMFIPAGTLLLTTEFGLLEVSPGEVVVVQRGMRFSVSLLSGPARGYVLEVFQGHFTLPDLGPIGETRLSLKGNTAAIAQHLIQQLSLVADI
eukprot:GHUV01049675.1.p1 GENE.GHUV01049675.1~~GHUV01049675.1.p1  ORF type:complete len:134 (-),score=29.92 GHUV01049675.1:75-476(-)